MKKNSYDAKCYRELLAEMQSVEHEASSYTRYCVRVELSAMFDGPSWVRANVRIAELSRAAYDASFVAEFGVDGAEAGQAAHASLVADNDASMADHEAGGDQAHKAWLKQFALIDRRAPQARLAASTIRGTTLERSQKLLHGPH